MQVAVTGGGTGGHIYPALEVARLLHDEGAEIRYLGSLRGQEGRICEQLGISFTGFKSRPLYSLKTVAGWSSLRQLLMATQAAKSELRRRSVNAVFSTGGYSAAPVMAAARALRIPYVIHESNSVPGRSNRMFAPAAKSFTCTFHKTVSLISYAIRTGQPIRRELRDVAGHRRRPTSPYVLGLGGSQGSQFINEVLPAAGSRFGVETEVLLATGRDNFEKVKGAPANVKLVPYLETAELVDAYRWATVAVARSGGTVAEFALFGIPSVLIPLPSSADNHQLVNAQEFVAFGGATLLEQKDATPEKLAGAIDAWHSDPERASKAREALLAWDAPEATGRIATLVRKAAETS